MKTGIIVWYEVEIIRFSPYSESSFGYLIVYITYLRRVIWIIRFFIVALEEV